MWRRFQFFCVCANFLSAAEFLGKTISEVAGAPAALRLETRAGDLYDPAKVGRDVHSLYATGTVSDVRVEAAPDGDAVRVTFRLHRKQTLRVRRLRLMPPTPGVRVELQPGAELDGQGAQQIAAGVRKQLAASGYSASKAEARLISVGPGTADLEVRIEKERPVDVDGVRLSGDLGVNHADVRRALHATRGKRLLPGIPGIWNGWLVRPPYTEDAVQADLANLRSFYCRRGYFDADVRVDSVDLSGRRARIAYDIQSGPRFHIQKLNGAPPPHDRAEYSVEAVCRDLFAARRNAERRGRLDFTARLEIRGEASAVEAATSVTTGAAYRVGRIDFRGNHQFSDESLRGSLLLDEGAPLDQTLLRKSLARINRTGWFEPLSERSIMVNTPPGSDRASVIIGLKEKKARSWNFSGPVGPMSVGGPLQFALGSRLPAWGRGLLELSTYTVSLHLMLFAKPVGALIPFLPNRRFIRILTIQRPLIPGQRWLSGFTIAPQFGWQGMLAGYGVSQTRNLLEGVLQSDRALTPDLPVTVSHEGHEGTLRCEAPKPRLGRVRQIAGMAVSVAFSFSPF